MNFSQRRTQIANIRETPQRPLGIYQHYMRVQGLEADDNGGGNAPTDGRPSKGTSREFLEALPKQIAMLHGGDAAGVDPPATRPVFAFPSTDSCRNRTCDMGAAAVNNADDADQAAVVQGPDGPDTKDRGQASVVQVERGLQLGLEVRCGGLRGWRPEWADRDKIRGAGAGLMWARRARAAVQAWRACWQGSKSTWLQGCPTTCQGPRAGQTTPSDSGMAWAKPGQEAGWSDGGQTRLLGGDMHHLSHDGGQGLEVLLAAAIGKGRLTDVGH